MPAGVSWSRYLSYTAVAMLTMLAGAQTVHYFYKPLDDLNILIEQEYEKQLKERKGRS
ncbi:protein brawnin [Diprion similis]|uniref:protein brawnin n=1 Tax=Diprion similis TaxID=362088 RepID=UPI001EF7C265|nr:protein brawnin [Diprion similis]